ncbi:MAG TPA: lipid-A-disaccharide synthase N-terminal domain-containing protein [Alphaproteobacteria bacterium]|nr:lipid-A-disaccharide synthase N-terminal domain-containing protein [Alphaproteobacteria bacterium]
MTAEQIWAAVGFIGQGMFFMRFIVQWIKSERARKSVVPDAFWYFSIAGAAISLIYAIHLGSWPFMAGQACGFIVYFRNLYLIHRHRGQAAA